MTARKPTGEEVTPDLTARGVQLTPEELGALGRSLAEATDPQEAARLREQLTRGCYGI